MKTSTYLKFILILIVLVATIYGQIPRTMTYQGYLKDSEGTPIDGSKTLTFTIYDNAGNQLWQEIHIAVPILKGLFTVILGETTALNLPFDKAYQLGIKVENEAELTPRIDLTSVSYSFHSLKADSVKNIPNNSVSTAKIQNKAVTAEKLADDVSLPPGGVAGGDLQGTYPNPTIKNNVVTTAKVVPDIVSNINGVSNDGGRIDLVAGSNITITPDDGANTVTIESSANISGSGSSNIIAKFSDSNVLSNSQIQESGEKIGIGISPSEVDALLYVYDDSRLAVQPFPSDFLKTYIALFQTHNRSLIGAVPETIAYIENDGDAYFKGNVDVGGTLSKGAGSFKIDHPLDPENKYLYHSFVESPDMLNVYNGNIILDENGKGLVELPDWFEALNKDFRYQLTCIGGYANVHISKKVSNNQFEIAGGYDGLEVSWMVTGVRKDPYAEKNRIEVEVAKNEKEKGKYLYPEAYGLSETTKNDNNGR